MFRLSLTCLKAAKSPYTAFVKALYQRVPAPKGPQRFKQIGQLWTKTAHLQGAGKKRVDAAIEMCAKLPKSVAVSKKRVSKKGGAKKKAVISKKTAIGAKPKAAKPVRKAGAGKRKIVSAKSRIAKSKKVARK